MSALRFRSQLSKVLLPCAGALCLFPGTSSAFALALGVALALTIGNAYLSTTRNLTHRLLSLSVIGLGASMNLETVARAGAHGLGYTLFGISLTLVLGIFLGRVLKTEPTTSALISVGTAICGGSAIAAAASPLRAQPPQISVALGTVFMLNALALVIFPPIGHALGLTEIQFGLWSALAIHDTSSVVGATLHYGPQALEIGTTVKLARALWIVPVTIALSSLAPMILAEPRGPSPSPSARAKRPWFILGFLLMAALVTWAPSLQAPGKWIAAIAKRGLVLTLFLIGANLTRETLRAVGIRPLILGVLLWASTASLTLLAILLHWIN